MGWRTDGDLQHSLASGDVHSLLLLQVFTQAALVVHMPSQHSSPPAVLHSAEEAQALGQGALSLGLRHSPPAFRLASRRRAVVQQTSPLAMSHSMEMLHALGQTEAGIHTLGL